MQKKEMRTVQFRNFTTNFRMEGAFSPNSV